MRSLLLVNFNHYACTGHMVNFSDSNNYFNTIFNIFLHRSHKIFFTRSILHWIHLNNGQTIFLFYNKFFHQVQCAITIQLFCLFTPFELIQKILNNRQKVFLFELDIFFFTFYCNTYKVLCQLGSKREMLIAFHKSSSPTAKE